MKYLKFKPDDVLLGDWFEKWLDNIFVDKETSLFGVVKTDKATVGEALQEHGLLEGEQGSFGLYVKKVNGITADFDIDQTYWAFYINGEYAMTGVDTTNIDESAEYKLLRTK